MGTEDSPESVRRSTRTTSTPHDAENETGEKTDTPTEETNEAVETNLDTGDDGPTITMDGESLVGVLSYLDDPDSYGPFVEDGRYVVERPRECPSVREFLESDQLFNVGVGPDVAANLRQGYEVVAGEEIASLAGRFGHELARYFDPRP